MQPQKELKESKQPQMNLDDEEDRLSNSNTLSELDYQEDFDPLSFIDEDILQNLLESPSKPEIEKGVKKFKGFLKDNNLPFKTVLQIFHCYFGLKDDSKKFALYLEELPKKLAIYHSANANSLLYRCLFYLVQKSQKKLELTLSSEDYKRRLSAEWKHIPLSNLKNFLEIFELHSFITEQLIEEHFVTFLNKKLYNECITILEQFIDRKELAKSFQTKLLSQMTNNKDASKAADIIKRFKLDVSDFPEIKTRLEKNCVRWYQKNFKWYMLEDIFSHYPQLLAYIAEDLYFHEEKNEAYTIIKRHDLITRKFIQKESIIKAVLEEESSLQVLEQILLTHDQFLPVEECVGEKEVGFHLNLEKDFGIKESSVVYIQHSNSQEELFSHAVKTILSSPEIGLDAEFVTEFTKLDNAKGESCLLQIATTSGEVFLFDLIALEEEKGEKWLQFLSDLLQGESLKSGVQIISDLQLLQKLAHKENISIHNYIDLQVLYKKVEIHDKQSSLAHISQKLFQKQLSKGEQQSNWARRPLRKSQIHYAAMDAVVSLRCLSQMRQHYGASLVNELIETFKK